MFEGEATGKVILLGEHAVVHGVPALAASISRGARVTALSTAAPSLCVSDASGSWKIAPDSDLLRAFEILNEFIGTHAEARAWLDIPTSAGLGSSASLGVALSRALLGMRGLPFDQGHVVNAATVWEKVFHGNPSGVDVAVATYGGCIEFSRSLGARPIALRIPVPLCIGDTGTRSSTRTMVDQVTLELRKQRDGGRSMLEAIGHCVELAREALPSGDWVRFGQAMEENQRLLRDLGLSIPQADILCQEACRAGALAAKVTGAGGGGCVIALAPGKQGDVLDAWRAMGFKGFSVDAGQSG